MKTDRRSLRNLEGRLTPRAPRSARATWLAVGVGALLLAVFVGAARDVLLGEPWSREAGVRLAWALERDLHPELAGGPAEVLADYERSCSDGYELACAWLEVRGERRPPPALVTSFFAHRCDFEGEPIACLAASWARRGSDPRAAVVGLELACDRGLVRACVELGLLVAEGVGVPRDAARARTLQEQTCAAGHPYGCALLGALLIEAGRMDEGLATLEAACPAEPRACTLLDELLPPTSQAPPTGD